MNKADQMKLLDKFIELNPDTKDDQFIYRDDRECIEWLCKHKIGHPIWDANDDYVHGCDGCCKNLKMVK